MGWDAAQYEGELLTTLAEIAKYTGINHSANAKAVCQALLEYLNEISDGQHKAAGLSQAAAGTRNRLCTRHRHGQATFPSVLSMSVDKERTAHGKPRVQPLGFGLAVASSMSFSVYQTEAAVSTAIPNPGIIKKEGF